MTRDDARQHRDIINTFINGTPIEVFGHMSGRWHECINPSFSPGCQYRIKPEVKRVPLDRSDFSGKCVWVRYVSYLSEEHLVTNICNAGISIGARSRWIHYNVLSTGYEYNDGTGWKPCSKGAASDT